MTIEATCILGKDSVGLMVGIGRQAGRQAGIKTQPEAG
jgi:hypothetical protein